MKSWMEELNSSNISKGDKKKPDLKDIYDKIAYIYDLVLLQYPKMGARISKLRAEQHMCSNLITGFSLIVIFLNLNPFIVLKILKMDMWFVFTLIIPVLIIVLSYLLLKHLYKRYAKALVNAYVLLYNTEVEE